MVKDTSDAPVFTKYKIGGGRQELRAINCLGIRAQLKQRGFRWEPGRGVWHKQLERGNEAAFFDWIRRSGWNLVDGGRAPFGLGG